MNATTVPVSRFGSEGQTLEYVVKVDGASEISAPAKGVDGLQVRIVETHKVGDGVEARVAVKVAEPVFY